MKKLLAILLAATMCVTLLAACGGQSNDTADTNGDTTATDTNDTKTDANADMIYAVETGSAGEAAAREKGWEINSVAAQADALMEVEAGTSDAAIIDLLMAGAMIGEGTSYPDLTYTRSEAHRPRSTASAAARAADLAALHQQCPGRDLRRRLHEEASPTPTSWPGRSWSSRPPPTPTHRPHRRRRGLHPGQGHAGRGHHRVRAHGLQGRQTATGSASTPTWPSWWPRSWAWSIEFTVINWDNKIMELDSKAIDVVWNGMTLTDEVTNSMECTNAYCNNAQVVVTKAAE